MRRACLFAILLTWAASAVATGSWKDLWDKGNACYRQKAYDSAAVYFEQIAAQKPRSAEVYYNLGNVYYRLHKTGPAVLNYERALKRKPDYKEASDNLALTQAAIPGRMLQVPDIFFIRWWRALTSPASSHAWAIGSMLLFIAFMALLIYRRMGKSFWGLAPQVTAGVAVLWLLALLLAFQSARRAATVERAVVMQKEVPLMTRPAAGEKPQEILSEGLTVRIQGTKGIWVAVSLPDSREGWVEQQYLHGVD